MTVYNTLNMACEESVGANASRKGQQPHVVAILPRGEAVRNFVYTGALDEVGEKVDVSVLSVVPNGELWGELEQRYVNVHPLEEKPERWITNILRELLDMSHGRWLWSEAAQERWRLRQVEATTPYRKFQRLGKKLACRPFAWRGGLELLSKLERAASYYFRTTDQYIDLFRQMRPSLVFNGSHIHSRPATQAVQAAQWLGIPTAAFIFSWDNLTSQGRITPPYDYYLVWNEGIRRQLLQIYRSVRPEQVLVTGTPQFDFHFRQEFHWTREEFCRHVGADPCRPIVLYSTGMPNHMPGEPRVVEGIAAMLREMTEFGPPQLLVRVYAKDRTNRFDPLRRTCPDVLFPEVPWEASWLTPRYEDTYLLANTLRHAAVGINVASTVSLELCMFDKPVINVGYNPPEKNVHSIEYRRYYEFDHYRPVVESAAVEVAHSEHDLRNMLRNALAEPGSRSRQRRDLLKVMFDGTLDGRSGSRVAELLVNLAQKGSKARV